MDDHLVEGDLRGDLGGQLDRAGLGHAVERAGRRATPRRARSGRRRSGRASRAEPAAVTRRLVPPSSPVLAGGRREGDATARRRGRAGRHGVRRAGVGSPSWSSRTPATTLRWRGSPVRGRVYARGRARTGLGRGHLGRRGDRKNSSSSAVDSSASTPLTTSGRWFRRRSRTTSQRLPTAPALSSYAPNTTRATRASTAAPAHIVHGSSVTTSVQPSSRHSPRAAAASRRATTSA